MHDRAAQGAVKSCEDTVEAEQGEAEGGYGKEAATECFTTGLLLETGLERVVRGGKRHRHGLKAFDFDF